MRGVNRMVQLLRSPDYGVTKATTPLARLLRTILRDLNVTDMEWERLVGKYLDDIMTTGEPIVSTRSTLKGNICKELSRPEMDWKVFCKSLCIINCDRVSMEIELRHLDMVFITAFDKINQTANSGRKLATIFKQLRLALKIGPREWLRLMNVYLNSPLLSIPKRGAERSAVKSKVDKELRTDSMTWKMFMRGMRFLGMHEMGITLTIHRDSKVTKHSLRITNIVDSACFQQRYTDQCKLEEEQRLKLVDVKIKSD